jgi:uncharacterized membrane protein YbhN (UPF0104 family)
MPAPGASRSACGAILARGIGAHWGGERSHLLAGARRHNLRVGRGCMRQIFSFVFATALLCAGLYVLYLQLHAQIIYFKILMMGAMMTVLGLFWLLGDFVRPLLSDRRRRIE